MHIGFDAKRFFHNRTGLGNYARSTILGLARHFPEHHYTLFTPRLTGPFCTLPAEHGLEVQEACPAGRVFPALWRSLGIPRSARAHELDIYHGLSHELPLKNFGPRTRTVVSMHDLLFLTHPHLYPWIDRPSALYIQIQAKLPPGGHGRGHQPENPDDVHEIFGITSASASPTKAAHRPSCPPRTRTTWAGCAGHTRCRSVSCSLWAP